MLADLGVARGDVVGILGKNSPETLLIALAAVKLGAAAGMLNHNQRGDVLAHSSRCSTARSWWCPEACGEAMDSLDEPPAVPSVLYFDDLDRLAEKAEDGNPEVCEQIQPGRRPSTSSPPAPRDCRRPA